MKKSEMNGDAVAAIIQLLKKRDLIPEHDAERIAQAFAGSDIDQFDQFLLDEGIVDKTDLLPVLSEYFQVPFYDVAGQFFDNLLINNFPKDFLLRHAVIPLERDGDELVVVAANPAISGLEHALRRYTEDDVIFMVGIRSDILDAIKEFADQALTLEIPEDSDLQEEHRQERQEAAYEDNFENLDIPKKD